MRLLVFCNILRYYEMSSHVMSCYRLWSDAVQWNEILWVCDAMWLVAMLRCVVQSGCMGWIGKWFSDPYYIDLFQNTIPVLQSTSLVLLFWIKYHYSTTKYDSNITLHYYKVFLRYYFLYYKVLICKARSTKVTKCCACYEKLFVPLILVICKTLFTIRRVIGVIF